MAAINIFIELLSSNRLRNRLFGLNLKLTSGSMTIIIVTIIDDTQHRVVLVHTKIIAFPVGYFIGAATKDIISKTTITISHRISRVGITEPSLLYSYGGVRCIITFTVQLVTPKIGTYKVQF